MKENRLDLNAIRKRAEAASSGPWAWEWADNGAEIEIVQPHLFLSPIVAESGIQADAEFIAHARQDVPALIAEVERLREALEAVKDRGLFYAVTSTEQHHAAEGMYRAAEEALK